MKLKSSLVLLVLLVSISVFTFSSFAGTTLGGTLEKNLTDDTLWYGGFLRTGGLFKLELGGSVPHSSNSSDTNLYSYFLMDLRMGSFDVNNGTLSLYFGASPAMTLNTSAPSFSISDSAAWSKIGLQLNLYPFAIDVHSSGKFDFSGNMEELRAGVGLGLTF